MQSNFNEQQDFDGFYTPPEASERPIDLRTAKDSRQYDFTVEEAIEMRERAAVEQAQRAGSAAMYLSEEIA